MQVTNQTVYDDGYPTCSATYASFLLYHEDLDPEAISARLSLTPSVTFVSGNATGRGTPTQKGGWFLSSESAVDSKDVRRHVDWLLDQLDGHEAELAWLRASGYDMAISCYWLSAEGHGGPTLSPPQMLRLANLGLEIWFDIY